MKIRMGFVSNSSSSSFCMMGMWSGSLEISDEFMNKAVASLTGLDRQEYDRCVKEYGIKEAREMLKSGFDGYVDFPCLISNILGDKIIYDGGSYFDDYFIGVSMLRIFDEPFNGDAHKMRKYTLEKLRVIDPKLKEGDIHIVSEGWYDG